MVIINRKATAHEPGPFVIRSDDRGPLKLGLIGDNIAHSSSPRLHGLAGGQHGIDVRYDRLVPAILKQSFGALFESCRRGEYRGVNITYPYKEMAAAYVRIDDSLVGAIGAVNTVIFEPDGPCGYNTDYSGFMSAYRNVRASAAAGTVVLIGAGGVGRAVAFGLARLGMTELRLADRDPDKAETLAKALSAHAPGIKIDVWNEPAAAAAGATGLVNCTPVGMAGLEGTPLQRSAMRDAAWAFDAVYTPVETQFLTDAAGEGLSVISGWELFFCQGVHAWRLFSGLAVDEDALRRDLGALG